MNDSRGIDADLLAILRCPRCRGTLAEDGAALVCARETCGARYPVVDGIPHLVVDEPKTTD